ncbi:MAG: adenylate kinase, partial [Desulfobacteraceae bacterium 4572_35.2]
GELIQREDDCESTIRNRMSVYDEQTLPLVEYYRKAGSLSCVDGMLPIDEVSKAVLAVLGGSV